jgi:hypothetical protein
MSRSPSCASRKIVSRKRTNNLVGLYCLQQLGHQTKAPWRPWRLTADGLTGIVLACRFRRLKVTRLPEQKQI